MKQSIRIALWGLFGIVVAAALSLGAFALAGDSLDGPSQIRVGSTAEQTPSTEATGDGSDRPSKDPTPSKTSSSSSATSSPDDHGGNSGSGGGDGDDNSGSGGGDDGDDNSGPGGGSDDDDDFDDD